MYAIEHSRAGFVLAGGKSTRMGSDKASLDFEGEGETLLERALRVIAEVCSPACIVGDPNKFSKPNFQTIPDLFPESGPLGGIHAALKWSTCELNLMLAVDMPYVEADLLASLLNAAASDQALVTVPRVEGRLQPLCAVYRRDFVVTAEAALRAGRFKIDPTFADVKTRVIEEAELSRGGFTARHFFNLNTPEDLLNKL